MSIVRFPAASPLVLSAVLVSAFAVSVPAFAAGAADVSRCPIDGSTGGGQPLAVVSRGALDLCGGELSITRDAQGFEHVTIVAPRGGRVLFRQKPTGTPPRTMSGQAQRIEYDEDSGLLRLFDRVRVARGQDGRLDEELHAERMTIDMRTHAVTGGGEGGRVRVRIPPRLPEGAAQERVQ